MKKLVKLLASASLMLALFIPTTVYAFTPEDFFKVNEDINASRDPNATAEQRAQSVQKAGDGLMDMMKHIASNQTKVVPFHGDLSIREISESIAAEIVRQDAAGGVDSVWFGERYWGLVDTHSIDPISGRFNSINGSLVSGNTQYAKWAGWNAALKEGKALLALLRFKENTLDLILTENSKERKNTEVFKHEIIAETDNAIVVEREDGKRLAFALEGNSLHMIYLSEDGRMTVSYEFKPVYVIQHGENTGKTSGLTPTTTKAPTPAPAVIKVILDEQAIAFDVQPQNINGRVMVPMRAVFEAMGATLSWDGATNTATATKGDMVVVLTVGSTTPKVNGNIVTLDQPAINDNGRILAPLRFAAEAFGGSVSWDGATQTATITSGS